MSADVGSLAEPLQSRVRALLLVANRDSTRVTVISARRSREQQIALRRQNCGPTQFDIYEKPPGACSPETAIPGTSKHETGEAVDFGGDLALVAELAPRFGLVATVPGEPWHYESSGGTALLGPGDAKDASPVGAAVAGVLSAPQAAAQGAGVLLRRETWMRVLGALIGLVLLGLAFAAITGDLALSSSGVGMTTGGMSDGAE